MSWLKIFDAANDIEADMICTLLKNEGIMTQRKYKGANSYLKILMGPIVHTEIWVPAEKAEEASLIIKVFSEEEE